MITQFDAERQIDIRRLATAHQTVRSQLLQERTPDGHWVGELSSSPLSTATAISALVLAEQHGGSGVLPTYDPGNDAFLTDTIYQGDLSELIVQSVRWLARQQNDDGGWGDTDKSHSNIATTMLVHAAFHLTGVPAEHSDLLERADRYVDSRGGVAGLKKQYGIYKTFAVPVLTNCALADMVPWRKVPALPFELACLPRHWHRLFHLPVVSYAIPALVAIGQARHIHAPSRNPILRRIRQAARKRSLDVLEKVQPASGGFLEAIPLTAFVVMSLASIGLAEHPVVRRGVEFLLTSVRGDGSWPIDTNLSVWNSTQAMVALEWDFQQTRPSVDLLTSQGAEPRIGQGAISQGLGVAHEGAKRSPTSEETAALDWLLACQHRKHHQTNGAELSRSGLGGWARTDLLGGIPDGENTSSALLALASWRRVFHQARTQEVESAARAGIGWLLKLQNRDGGWPTFCRGWRKLSFDRSSADTTAHALRALHHWRGLLRSEREAPPMDESIGQATHHGLQYMEGRQREDGSWVPLWFGNQYHPESLNLVVGTAKVLLMCCELGLQQTEMAQRGLHWLVDAQLASGGWGPALDPPSLRLRTSQPNLPEEPHWSVEESSLAVEALLGFHGQGQLVDSTLERGLGWLIHAVLEGQHHNPAPIGFYFAKLWYHERLYPQIFATRTLTRAAIIGGHPWPDASHQAVQVVR